MNLADVEIRSRVSPPHRKPICIDRASSCRTTLVTARCTRSLLWAVAASLGFGLAACGKGGIDPARYGTLHHPGDAYSYDIFTQVARALRVRGSGVLGGLRPERILGVGESQSAGTLTTYVDGIQPLTDALTAS